MSGVGEIGGEGVIAFTHLVKAAGTTLHHSLRRTLGMRYTVVAKRWADTQGIRPHDLVRLKRRYPRLLGFGGHGVRPYLLEESPMPLRFITVLRRPETRVVSHYLHEVRRELTADSFLGWLSDETRHNHQCRNLAGAPEADAAIEILERRFSFVGLVERYPESMNRLGAVIPGFAPLPSRTRANVNPEEEIKARLEEDPVVQSAIAEVDTEDAKLYDHVVENIWPSQPLPARPAPPTSELVLEARRRSSLAKERLVLGVPRWMTRRGMYPPRWVV